MRGPDNRQRLLAILGFAVLSGIWAYGEKKNWGFASGDVAAVGLLVLAVGVGCFVCRATAAAALLGPVLALGYLQLDGYVSPDDDGADPLFSVVGVSTLAWLAAFLLLGAWIGRLLQQKTGRGETRSG